MRHALAIGGLFAILLLVLTPGGSLFAGQPHDDGADATVLRTPYGHPDLQGVWSNNGATPLERPPVFGDRAELTEEELAEIRERADELVNAEDDAGATVFGDYLFRQIVDDPSLRLFDTDTGNYNAFWIAERTFDDRRTSLIVNPPDGRVPPLTETAKTRRTPTATAGRFDGPDTMSLSDRCITYGAPNLMTGYNSYFQIVQSPTHVAIVQELIHDARIISLDGRPMLTADIRQWHGSSRGWWEDETLVIETTNYSPQTGFVSLNAASATAGAAGEHLRVVERLTRADPDTLRYQVTFHDDTTWTQPWTALVFMKRSDDAIFEYACHEGNYAMEGMLAGARVQEQGYDSSSGSVSQAR